jgi:hypothetical protein
LWGRNGGRWDPSGIAGGLTSGQFRPPRHYHPAFRDEGGPSGRGRIRH